jgi:hypothetical protein
MARHLAIFVLFLSVQAACATTYHAAARPSTADDAQWIEQQGDVTVEFDTPTTPRVLSLSTRPIERPADVLCAGDGPCQKPFVAIDADALQLKGVWVGTPLVRGYVPIEKVRALEVRRHNYGAIAAGLGIGVLAGATLGVVEGYATSPACDRDPSSEAISLCLPRPFTAGLLGVAGGVVGGLAGALTGAVIAAIGRRTVWVF